MPDRDPRPERASVVRQFQRWCVIDGEQIKVSDTQDDAINQAFAKAASGNKTARIARCTIFVES